MDSNLPSMATKARGHDLVCMAVLFKPSHVHAAQRQKQPSPPAALLVFSAALCELQSKR